MSFRRSWILAIVGSLALGATGCREPESVHIKEIKGKSGQTSTQDELFKQLADSLNRLDEFDSNLPLIRDRLNHWVRQQPPAAAKWQVDPLVSTLPEDLQELPELQKLGNAEFSIDDVQALQTIGWLRDISRLAKSEQIEELPVATQLFDWTVRQLQLERRSLEQDAHRPSEILLTGHATALERAWIFSLLARQQKLDVVLLAPGDAEDPQASHLLAALVQGQDLYLFDPGLGLPIPGPNDKPVATLAEVRADDSLLRRLDLDEENPFPLTADSLRKVTALVEASPEYLAQNMRIVESKLSGKQAMVLWLPATPLAERLKAAGVDEVRLLPRPYEVLAARAQMNEEERRAAGLKMFRLQTDMPLRRGRMAQFHGQLDGAKGAKKLFLSARPSRQQLTDIKERPETFLPQQTRMNLKPETLDRLVAEQVKVLELAKEDASFWLGLVSFDEKDFPVAIDYFAERTLKASPGGQRTGGARYNLARAYEANGDIDKAIENYELDRSPQSHGNKLRARMLKKDVAPSETPTTEEKPAEEKPADDKPDAAKPEASAPPAATDADSK